MIFIFIKWQSSIDPGLLKNQNDRISVSSSDVLFTHDGEQFYLEYGTLRFSWNMGLQWFLTLEDTHVAANPNTQFKGLCGDYNDNASGNNFKFCS